MTLLRKAWLSVWERRIGLLWTVSLFLVGVGARLWLIRGFGTPVPFWDEWEIARVVYLPFFAGKLSFAALFSAHNEHRIFFTRVYELALLLLNGQWDGQLEMVCNAIIHCATVAGLGGLMFYWQEKRYWSLVWLPLAAVLVLPFGWENSLAGFQSQFYFLLVFSLLVLGLLGLYPAWSRGWWCGLAAAVMALFTVASGFLAAAAVFALVVVRIARRLDGWKKQAPTLAFCAAVCLAGLLLKADVSHHHALQAHSIGEFLAALGANLAWPWIVVPPFAPLNLLPLLALGWQYFRTRGEAQPAEEFTLALGFWAVLQGAATAYARGAEGKPPGWRYMDSSSFILIANCFSIIILLSRGWPINASPVRRNRSLARQILQRPRTLLMTAFVLWGIACAMGLVLLTTRAWQIDIPERQFCYRAQLKHARAFMATDDLSVFERIPKEQLLYYPGDPLAPPPRYKAEWTVGYLRNPLIRSILPACLRLPLQVRPDPAASHGFTTNGLPEPIRPRTSEVCWSSYGKNGAAARGHFESLPVPRSKLPYLEFPVAGDLAKPGLSLSLTDQRSQKTEAIRPSHAAGDKWQCCDMRAPPGDFQIIASDESDTGWLAFQAPRELGGLSWAAGRLLALGGRLFFAGLILWLGGLVLVLKQCRTFTSTSCNPRG